MDDQPVAWSFFRLWLVYAAIGTLFGGVLFIFGGDAVLPQAIAISAIFVAIGTIIVGTSVWGLLRSKRRQ